jgi:uncharacterized protein (TIGR01777 family)
MGGMKVLVTGASGLIGGALCAALASDGHQVVRLVRRPPQGTAEAQWDPLAVNPAPFEGGDAVVHLAGENIAGGRWSAARKSRIVNSRVQGTETLATSLARTNQRPKVLVSASAIGYYGSRGDEVLTEASAAGAGFLAETCRQWEAATQPAVAAGIRVVLVRTGLVLSPRGGALAKMLTPFRLGVGGRVGTGRQWWSWISLEDEVDLMLHALTNASLRGPVNAAAPNPVTNAEFTRILGRVLRRPTLFPVPAFAVRLMFGEMGEELLLASQRVQPAAALASGFRFAYADLEGALRSLLRG